MEETRRTSFLSPAVTTVAPISHRPNQPHSQKLHTPYFSEPVPYLKTIGSSSCCGAGSRAGGSGGFRQGGRNRPVLQDSSSRPESVADAPPVGHWARPGSVAELVGHVSSHWGLDDPGPARNRTESTFPSYGLQMPKWSRIFFRQLLTKLLVPSTLPSREAVTCQRFAMCSASSA